MTPSFSLISLLISPYFGSSLSLPPAILIAITSNSEYVPRKVGNTRNLAPYHPYCLQRYAFSTSLTHRYGVVLIY